MTTQEFNKQLEPIEGLLFGFAMRLTKNRDKAKDLMQETLYLAFKNRHRFAVHTNFKAWITTIMRNSFINEYRKNKTRNEVINPVEEISHLVDTNMIAPTGESIIMLKELQYMIGTLSNDLQIAFNLFLAGYQYSEIAEMTNVPIGTVKSRIYFARKKLRIRLKIYYAQIIFNSV